LWLWARRAGASDVKFCLPLGFAKAIIKSHPEEKGGMDLDYGNSQKFGDSPSIFTQWLKLATSNLVHLGFSKPYHKITSIGKVDLALG